MGTYKTAAEARPAIEKLVERNLLKGIAEDDLRLSGELVRTLVILDRAGAFDRENI